MSDWEALRKFTQARIGLGRAGHAVPTREHLRFQLDHARARDAVHWAWHLEKFGQDLKKSKIPSTALQTAVKDRTQYLTRPDLGRTLNPACAKKLTNKPKRRTEIAIIVSNGLSSSAVENHGHAFVTRLWRELKDEGRVLSPVCLVDNARVALSDDIGRRLGAEIALMILGERPGLSSFDSLALYLTYHPQPGNTDAQRNCVSNIRPPEGLSYESAVKKTLFLVNESLRRKLSGVDLKEEAGLLR
jgi:ethanolamine ammonia-lyase small subunit